MPESGEELLPTDLGAEPGYGATVAGVAKDAGFTQKEMEAG